jgi:hypothetical protein
MAGPTSLGLQCLILRCFLQGLSVLPGLAVPLGLERLLLRLRLLHPVGLLALARL